MDGKLRIYFAEQFVLHYLAKELKDIGFDEPCIAFYNHEEEVNTFEQDLNQNATLYRHSEIKPEIVLAPLTQQVIDWFWEKHNVGLEYCPQKDIMDIEIMKAIESIKEKMQK